MRLHGLQRLHGLLDIQNQRIAATSAKVLTDHNPHQLDVPGVRCEGIRRYDPSPLAELMGDGELVEMVFVLGVEAERNERETGAVALAEDDKTHRLDALG